MSSTKCRLDSYNVQGRGFLLTKGGHRALYSVVVAIWTASASSAAAQFEIDRRVIGDWVKVGTGDRFEVRGDGEVALSFGGQAAVFSGLGSIQRCTEGGANICVSGARLKCAYHYVFSAGGIMTLRLTAGEPAIACTALAGDFRRRAAD
jgi:hypothetical protein